MLTELLKKHFLTYTQLIWSNKVVTFKKVPTLYSVKIEADKICFKKKKKDMLDSEKQKQPLT